MSTSQPPHVAACKTRAEPAQASGNEATPVAGVGVAADKAEALASNQELTAANEELRAANEELHALNDELQANRAQMQLVTEELRRQNLALDAANDALKHLIDASNAARDRARARAEYMQRFLNEAGRMLLSELVESRSALEKLARMAVPALGDVCLIDVVGDDGKIAPAALACAGGSAALPRLDAQLERDPDGVIANVVRSGRSALEAQLDDAALVRIGGACAELLRASRARSYLCVPVQGRGAVLGALSLASTRPEQRYGADDIALAEGLGQRAGMAMETARQYRAAHEAVQLRDEFLAIASHELRTPLTALSLQLENLRALLPAPAHPGDSRSGAAEKVGHALRYTLRLARLIDSLVAVSRITAGHLTLQLDDVDLSQIAREVVERMRTDAARARCTLELHADAEVRGHWDAIRLDQVVSNLLSNAFRYASGTRVRVSVGVNEQCATLSVEDAGPGIARERLPLIFERYEIAGERSTSGLGLGLYIIRQIAEAHGGHARVETEVGHGARFLVELPFAGLVPGLREPPAAADKAS